MNHRQSTRGSVTICLAIVLLAMLLFTGLFVDLARIKVAQNQLRRAVDASARSVLAGYNPVLKNEYGLFATSVPGQSEDFARYLQANLSGWTEQRFRLFDYRCEETELTMVQPLGDIAVLKQQILEDMKYAAPVEMTRDLIEKFKSVKGASGSAREYGEAREITSSLDRDLELAREINRKIKHHRETLRQTNRSLATLEQQLQTAGAGETDSARRAELLAQKKALEQSAAESQAGLELELKRSESVRKQIQDKLQVLRQSPPVQDGSAGDQTDDQYDTGRILERMTTSLATEAARLLQEMEQLGRDGSAETEASAARQFAADREVPPETEAERRNRSLLMQELDKQPETIPIKPEYSRREELEQFGQDEADNQLEEKVRTVDRILSLGERITDSQEEIFINEYILARMAYITQPRGGDQYRYRDIEAEYILYSGAARDAAPELIKAEAVAKVYGIRFTLDAVAYFAFSKVPPDLRARAIYALVMGAIQAAVDTRALTSGGTVLVAEMRPVSSNPLARTNIRLNYKDHLRVLLLLSQNETKKLTRITELIAARTGIDPARKHTVAVGSATVSIKLWFLPLAGIRNTGSGPFGTVIKDGRCYLTKTVESRY